MKGIKRDLDKKRKVAFYNAFKTAFPTLSKAVCTFAKIFFIGVGIIFVLITCFIPREVILTERGIILATIIAVIVMIPALILAVKRTLK